MVNGKWERTGLALHPGTISEGCISVAKDQWPAAAAIISGGTLTYRGTQTFAGIL